MQKDTLLTELKDDDEEEEDEKVEEESKNTFKNKYEEF